MSALVSEPIAPYAPKPDPKLYYFDLQILPETTVDEVTAFFAEHRITPTPVKIWDGLDSQIVRYDIGTPAYLEVPHGGYIRMLTNPTGEYASADVADIALAEDPGMVEQPATTPDGGGLE